MFHEVGWGGRGSGNVSGIGSARVKRTPFLRGGEEEEEAACAMSLLLVSLPRESENGCCVTTRHVTVPAAAGSGLGRGTALAAGLARPPDAGA